MSIHQILATEIMSGLAKAFKGSESDSKYDTIATSIMKGIAKHIKAAPIKFQLDTTGLDKQFSDINTKINNHVGFFERLYSKLPPDIAAHPAARRTFEFLNKLETGFKHAAEVVGGSFGNVIHTIGEFVSSMSKWIAALSIPLVAMIDMQDDMKTIIVQNTGSTTDRFNDVASAINNAAAASGVGHRNIIKLATAMSDLGVLSRMSKDELQGYLTNSANWMKVYGYTAEEAAGISVSMYKMGIAFSDSNKMVNEAFEVGKSYNLSLTETRDGLKDAVGLMSEWGMVGVESTQVVVSGLLRAEALYKEMGISTKAAVEAAKKFGDLTSPETIRGLAMMSRYTGQTIESLNRLRQNDFGAFMIQRANAGMAMMTQQASTMNIDPATLFGPGDKDVGTLRAIQMIKKRMKDTLQMSDEEVNKLFSGMQKYVADKLPALLAKGLTQQQAMIKLQQEYITDMQNRAKQEANAQNSLDDVNELWVTIKGSLMAVGHALLISIGLPLLNMVAPAIKIIASVLKGMGSAIEFLAGPLGLVTKIVGYIAAGWLVAAAALSVIAAMVRAQAVAVAVLEGAYKLARIAAAEFNMTLVANPIMLLLTLVAAVGIAIYANWDSIKKILSPITNLFSNIWSVIKAIGGVLLSVFELIVDVVELVGGALIGVLEPVLDVISSIAGFFSDVVSVVASSVWDAITWPFREIWSILKSIGGFFSNIFGPTFKKIGEVISPVVNMFKDMGSIIADYILAPFKQIMEWINGIKGVIDWFHKEKKEKGTVAAVREAAKMFSSKSPTYIQVPSAPGHGGLGELSKKYESGNAGSAAVGFDSTGGASYGKYQISQHAGTLNEFMRYTAQKNKAVYDQLSPLMGTSADKNGAFAQKWKDLAKQGKLEDLQQQFIKTTHYDPSMMVMQQHGVDTSKMSKTLQDVIWSRSVQLGAGNFKNMVDHMGNLAGKSDKDIISEMYNRSSAYFTRNTPAERSSVNQRLLREKAEALTQLNADTQQRQIAAAQPKQQSTTPSISPEAEKALIAMHHDVREDIKRRRGDSDHAKVTQARRNTGDYGVSSMLAEGAV